MPTSYLWSVSSEGKIYLLSSSGQQWEEMSCGGLSMKRVSALQHCAWALGGDNQIYVYVVSSDVPIRIKETTYENQRWILTVGFSDLLLPTDRPAWSSQDGSVERTKEQIHLPTSSWAWEGEWMIDDSLDGQPLGQEGWTYALDFPRNYGREKKFSSMVRRRRWYRYRQFVAVDKWIHIPGISSDSSIEPFIDICAGGTELPGSDNGEILVWAVTVQGRVMFRQGVTRERPEGNGWFHVEGPGKEISNLSVGLTGLVWAVTWDGKIFARTGITRNKATGNNWVEIEALDDECHFLQVSVGIDVVWAVSRDNRIWFRIGIRGRESGKDESKACGSGWVEMVGSMSSISVGPFDQVWAVSKNEPNVINFRTGVTSTDLNGKTWKRIVLPLINRIDSDNDLSRCIVGDRGTDSTSSGIETESDNNFESIKMKTLENVNSSGSETSSPQLLRGSVSSLQDSLMGAEDDFVPDPQLAIAWLWVSAGACRVDQLHLPNWFSLFSINCNVVLSEPWRKEISVKLDDRKRELGKFKYQNAIDNGSWKKNGICHYLKDNQWMEGWLELEKMNLDTKIEATLTISINKNIYKINLDDITCLMCGSDINKPVLTIHTERKENEKSNCANHMSFSDTELEDWVAVLSSTCCDIRDIIGAPSRNAIWGTTNRGDIFTHNPVSGSENLRLTSMFWRQMGGHLKSIETSSYGITWGISYDHVPYVYTGGWGGAFFQGLASSSFGIQSIFDTRQLYIYENQRWNPLTGFSTSRLPTDRFLWSDVTGKYECTKENTRLPSMRWQWIMDWTIDYYTPGGVDRDGWQYAKDFPSNYHSRKGMTDCVRRRRWKRKCKLSSTGPWDAVESVHLREISFQVDHPGPDRPDLPLDMWAVDTKGNVLYRHGVTNLNPKGTRWEHVPSDYSFCSVSVGAGGRVWAVSTDGSAFFRSGINSSSPVGEVWFHVEPPEPGISLRQVSVGGMSVWAVDQTGGLWYREEVMPMFPEGTCWKRIGDEVLRVSVNMDDNVWVIAKVVNINGGALNNVLCRRKNITESNKVGAGWEYGIGNGWNHVSIRACDEYKYET